MQSRFESNHPAAPKMEFTPKDWRWLDLPSELEPVLLRSITRGFTWKNDLGHFCLLTDIAPALTDQSRETQTLILLDQLEATIERLGFTFDQVARTWFFLDDIHSWYSEFNRVRSRFLSQRGLLGRAPASTAVGASNERRAAIQAHLLAFRPNESSKMEPILRSPLQSAALEYGSSFSRGMLIRAATRKRLLISGTASIDANGVTVYPFDTGRQITETFKVVGAMLREHDLEFSDVQQALCYLTDLEDEPLLRTVWQHHIGLPLSVMQADICRRDLRFEIELTAERPAC